jgi:hypothetical protein
MPEPLPSRPSPTPQRGSAWSLLLAGGAGLLLVAGFVLLVFVALGPTGAAAVGIGAAIFAIVGLQYLAWGWWLGPAIRRRAKQGDKRESS